MWVSERVSEQVSRLEQVVHSDVQEGDTEGQPGLRTQKGPYARPQAVQGMTGIGSSSHT